MLGDLHDMRPNQLWLYMEHEEVKSFVGKYKRGEVSATWANLNIRRIVWQLNHSLPYLPADDHPRQNRSGRAPSLQDVNTLQHAGPPFVALRANQSVSSARLAGDSRNPPIEVLFKGLSATRGRSQVPPLQPMRVGLSHNNHDGLFVSAVDVRQVLGSIAGSGFSSGAASDVPCGAAQQSDMSRYIWHDTPHPRLASTSEDDGPEVAHGSTTYAFLSGSHLNAGLRAIASNGHWGSSALANYAADPCFHQAINDGLHWHVISPHVVRSYPALGVGHAEDQPEPRYTLQV